MLAPELLAAARQAAAVGPVLNPAFLRLTGKDARSFLHRMSTQDLAVLGPGQSAYAAFLTAKGHIVADAHVLVRDAEVLLSLDPAAAGAVRAHLEAYVIMDEVAIEEGPPLRVLPVLGPKGPPRIEGRAAAAARVPNSRRGVPALDLWLGAPEAERLRGELAALGLPMLGEEDLEALRILGAVPRFGTELLRSRLLVEAGLERDTVSFTKGCYIGQEIVLRATARGHLQRGLVQLALPRDAAAGTPLFSGGSEVGTVTSAADTPEGRVGLGYLQRAHWREGDRLSAAGGEAIVTKVVVGEGNSRPVPPSA